MDDDSLIEGLLEAALAAPAPTPSDRFRADVMRRVAQRRLSPWGAATLAAYGLASGIVCVWLLRDIPPSLVFGFLVAGAGVATSAGLYACRLARLD
jgi:hypothetical protein